MTATEVVERVVAVDKLQVGMYVCRLDRSWLGTPFKIQGVEIRGQEDIDTLAQFCQFVFIDDLRSIYAGKRKRPDYSYLPRLLRADALARLDRLGFRNMRGPDRPPLIPIDYPPAIELAKELPRAQFAWKAARQQLAQMIANARVGKKFSAEDLDIAVEPVVESVVRSPDAALWMSAMRRQEPYPISHPLNCCALVLVFARFLGFPPEILQSLAKGALVLDIGMWRLEQNYYFNREEVGPAAKEQIRDHVIEGLGFLKESGFLDVDANLMILHHHERFDGNGYPRRLQGDKISLMGQMMNIVDAFDAMCSKRSYRDEESISAAQRQLYAERDKAYLPEVVEVFFQSLGVYPTGALVELSNGAIAAVSGQIPTSRLYPRLIVLTHPDRSMRAEFEEVDSAELIKLPEPIKILRSVASGSIDIKLDQVQPKVRGG